VSGPSDYDDSKPYRRPHRATGKKPPGGHRPGAGRPEGTFNALPPGYVQALKGLKHRVPEGTPEPLADVAGTALDRLVDVMMERVEDPQLAAQVLKASTLIRAEICGPPTQRMEHTGANGESLVVEVRKYPKADAE